MHNSKRALKNKTVFTPHDWDNPYGKETEKTCKNFLLPTIVNVYVLYALYV